ncbi:LysR family transcriptional regulator [Pseudomonas syringae]|uniref:LysR family transcriptional regulator n=1 Tax=Pseudomonas syringae TaxID=317 RepID=UPI00215662FA|nr:LysR family transcriptional regulator [Pseudomonas syringae]
MFVRGDDGFRLTIIGEEVLAAAEKILAMHDNLFRLKNKNPDSELRLGMPDDYGLFFLRGIVKALALSNPDLKIKLVCETSLLLIDDVDQRRLDMAVIAVPESRVMEHSEYIRHEELHCIGDARLVRAGQGIRYRWCIFPMDVYAERSLSNPCSLPGWRPRYDSPQSPILPFSMPSVLV